MMNNRPHVITIAGHDPSGGAGLTADCKVLEAWGVQGQSVCSAITIQNEDEFRSPGWVAWPQIEAQLEILYAKQRVHYFKIGIVENEQTLRSILTWIRSKDPSAFILWDPILKASAGFDFHSQEQRSSFRELCKLVSLITPNQVEYEWLQGDLACPVLLKGGHQAGDYCTDTLIYAGRVIDSYIQPRIMGASKHGSGCVLSASIIALMAKGLRLERACELSRNFLQEYLQSAPGLLGNIQDSFTQNLLREVQDVEPILHTRLYAITWDGSSASHIEQVQALCESRVRLVQLRMKSTQPSERIEIAWQCLRVCRQWGSTLVINDDVELARMIGASAVHLGLTDMPVNEARALLGSSVLIGGTANTVEHVVMRIAEGVDYIGLGPWRFTGTKEKINTILGAIGVETIMNTIRSLGSSIPVYVIGGVTPKDCKEILELGATGVAVSSYIVSDKHPQMRVREFRDTMAPIGNRL
jgi:thiamine-phosphate pyrophosphorylase